MEDLKIKDGDITLHSRGIPDLVTGSRKVAQDLKRWLLDDPAYNRFHPWMGSTIDEFVGQIPSERVRFDIRQVVRVALNTYSAAIMQDIKARIEERGNSTVAIMLADPSSFVREWTDLDVIQDGGNYRVYVGYRTYTDEQETLQVLLASGNYGEGVTGGELPSPSVPTDGTTPDGGSSGGSSVPAAIGSPNLPVDTGPAPASDI